MRNVEAISSRPVDGNCSYDAWLEQIIVLIACRLRPGGPDRTAEAYRTPASVDSR